MYFLVPPQILPFEFSEEAVNEGDGVSVQCTVSKGDYPLNITWYLNGLTIQQGDGILVNRASKRVSTLSIDSVQAFHSGNYTCLASNKADATSITRILVVNGI